MAVSISNFRGPIGGGSNMGMNMAENSGLFGKIAAYLDTLPIWLSIIIMLIVVILLGFIAGKIIGKIVGNIVYPDPEKETIFNLKQRVMFASVIGGTIIISALIIYLAQKPSDVIETGNNGMDMNMSQDIGIDDGMIVGGETIDMESSSNQSEPMGDMAENSSEASENSGDETSSEFEDTDNSSDTENSAEETSSESASSEAAENESSAEVSSSSSSASVPPMAR